MRLVECRTGVYPSIGGSSRPSAKGLDQILSMCANDDTQTPERSSMTFLNV